MEYLLDISDGILNRRGKKEVTLTYVPEIVSSPDSSSYFPDQI